MATQQKQMTTRITTPNNTTKKISVGWIAGLSFSEKALPDLVAVDSKAAPSKPDTTASVMLSTRASETALVT